jgi:hypothetical protein
MTQTKHNANGMFYSAVGRLHCHAQETRWALLSEEGGNTWSGQAWMKAERAKPSADANQ